MCDPLQESVSKHHTDNEQYEYHSTASDTPLVQESNHGKSTMIPHHLQPVNAAEGPQHIINEQENMMYRGSDKLSEDQQQLDGHKQYTSPQDLHRGQILVHRHISEKPVSDSTAALEDPLINSAHQFPYGVLQSNDDKDDVNLLDIHSSEYPYASSRQGTDDETHNLQANMNELHIPGRVRSTDTVADDVYTNPKLPSDHVNFDVQGETYQSLMESSTGVDHSQLLTGTIGGSPSPRPSAYPMGDNTVSTTLPHEDNHTPVFEELQPTQDYGASDSQVDTVQDVTDHTQKQVTLRSGKVGDVQFLQDWTAQVTLPDGSTMNVDYDYFHGLDIDLPTEYYDYDYVPGVTSGNMDYEESTVDKTEAKESSSVNYQVESLLSETVSNVNVENHEELAQLKLESHSPPASSQHETKSHYLTSRDIHVLHTSGDENIHNYLNIYSLQQRYQHGRTSESPKVTLDAEVDYVVPEKTVFDESCQHSVGCTLHFPGYDSSSEIPHTSNEHVLSKDTEQGSIHKPPAPVSQNEPIILTTGTLYEELYHEETAMPQLSDGNSVPSPPPEQFKEHIPPLSGTCTLC